MKSKSSTTQNESNPSDSNSFSLNELKKLSTKELETFAIALLQKHQKLEASAASVHTKYTTLLKVNPHPIFVVSKLGVILELNQKTIDITGYNKEDLINKHFLKLPFFYLKDIPKYTKLFYKIIKSEVSTLENIRWKTKTGHTKYSNAFLDLIYDKQGKLKGFIGVITDTINKEIHYNQTESEYYDLIEKTQISVLTDDSQGNITTCNTHFLNLFEYSKEDIKQLDLSHWVYPDDLPLVIKNHKARLKGKKAPDHYEFRAKSKTGKIIWCEVKVIPIEENGTRIGSRSYLWDISKRKADEKQMEEQSQLLHSAIESLTEPFYVIDVYDYSIKLANTASGLKIGQKKLHPSNPKCYESTHNRKIPCDGDEHPCPIKNILKTRKPCITEHIHYDKNGIAKHVEIRGYPIFNQKNQITQIIEHAIDITDKKLAAELIRKEKQQTQTYLDIAAVMLVVLDTNQKVVLCNKEGLKILGYSENELIGKNWFDTVIPENERIVVKEVFDAFVKEKIDAPEYFENFILTKNGEKKLIAWKNSFISDEEGKIEKLISSGEDITWKRKTEEVLKESEKKYHDLFENHSAAKLIVDIETAQIIDCNKAATEFYGWSKKELKSMNIRQINLLSPAEFEQRMKMIKTKKQKFFEFKHKCANGKIKDVEVYVGRVIINGKECVHAVIHDITLRKQSQKLLDQKHKLDATLAKLFVPLSKENISITEIAYSVYQEALALTNSAICYVATIDDENSNNLIAHTLTDMLDDGSCNIAQQEMRKIIFSRAKDGKFPALFGYALNRKESFFTNNTSQHPESTGVPEGHIKIDKFLSVPVLLNQELVGQIALANPEEDYTQDDLNTIEHLAEYMSLAIQRHRASEKIKSSEKRFKTVAENSGEWIWEVDANGLFTYSSPVVFEINGYTAEELVGKKHYFDFYAKEMHQAKMQEAAELFKAMKSFSGIEDKILHKDGSEISIETKGIPIIDESGQLKGYMGSTVNITEKKQAEADLIKHARELEIFNNAMVDREMRIIEMKEEVNTLCKSLNMELRYPEQWK